MKQEENYYSQIKEEYLLHKAYKNTIKLRSNLKDLNHYYNIGKLLIEAQGGEERAHYGDGLINKFSNMMSDELGEGYSIKTLKRCRKYYLLSQKGSAVLTQLTWSHILELLPIKNINEINYYANQAVTQNLGYRDLRNLIKSKEYERLSEETKNKLINHEEVSISDLIKDPIIINSNKLDLKERELQQVILDNISSFLHQLGQGFAYIDNEYKISINNTYNYIDILLYNYVYKCFVVVELKVSELKKEHIGQIQVYMNYIDEHVKSINDNKTIGIIVYKEGNKYLLHYCNNDNLFATKYILLN